ncbi:Endonuclease/exonuclease/phosphatase [Mollivirus sibericum]|uniref:Endonuclease/exonuclease/phosphatase n=1 Tax=Mollivirus sibericum TaxID=1678078 RepID=UPI0006B2EC57|nr:Endonuclease/exonuclease/phosphatase [Mollivirus sibericum]ALD61827.1 Endonuclease/exonuclease/phosphatase [Mollivirus sibericum]
MQSTATTTTADVYHAMLRTSFVPAHPEEGNQQQETGIKTLTLNINDAFREEKVPGFEFKKRLPDILALILEQKPDVLFLVEVTQTEHRNLLVFELTNMGFRVIYGERNASPGCTANLIAFDPARFQLTKTENIQLLSDDAELPGDTSMINGWGANLFVAHVLLSQNNKVVVPKRELVLGATHFPIHEASRQACTEAIRLWLENHEKHRYIVSGDLNTFHDKGGPGQIAKLREVATVEGETSICHVTGRKVLGTYFGYPHDRFCFDVDKFLDPLDYVITNPAFATFAGPLHTDTRFIPAKAQEDAPIGTRAPLVYASDHLPLIARINLTL